MKKLLTRLGILSLCVVSLVLMTSHSLSQNTGDLAANYRAMPDRIQICNTGDSHGASGFDYANSGYSGFNFALGSQPITYDYSLLDQYKEHIEPGAVVLINLSYFTLWADDSTAAGRDNRDLRYLQILDSTRMHFERPVDDLMNRYARVLTYADRKIMTIFKEPQGAMMDEGAVEESGLTIEEIGKRRAQYHLRHFLNAQGSMKPPNVKNLEYLNRILELCKERQWKAVLIVTPYLDVYSKWFDSALLQTFSSAVEACAESYSVPFWNFANDERFTFDASLFKDSDHLNAKGAKIFTALVIGELERTGLIRASNGTA